MSINSSQWNALDVQVDSVARFFKTSDAETIANELYKRINKINNVKRITEITPQQYNDTMHWLFNIEKAARQWYLAQCFIDKELQKSLFKRDIEKHKDEFNRPFSAIESLTRAQELSKELVNLNVLTKLF